MLQLCFQNGFRLKILFFVLYLTQYFGVIHTSLDSFTAGSDYPNLEYVPDGLSFTCNDKLPGFYADMETRCQVWHWCVLPNLKYSFICTPGTVFNQATRVCDWFFNVDCPSSPGLYGINSDLYKDSYGNYIYG